MPSIKDLFPEKWLKPHHLITADGRRPAVTVVIVAAVVELLFSPRTKREEPRLVVQFQGKRLRLVCNKTQALAIAAVTGTDDYTAWRGHSVTLSVGRAPNGSDTIVITAPPQKPDADEEELPAGDAADAEP